MIIEFTQEPAIFWNSFMPGHNEPEHVTGLVMAVYVYASLMANFAWAFLYMYSNLFYIQVKLVFSKFHCLSHSGLWDENQILFANVELLLFSNLSLFLSFRKV